MLAELADQGTFLRRACDVRVWIVENRRLVTVIAPCVLAKLAQSNPLITIALYAINRDRHISCSSQNIVKNFSFWFSVLCSSDRIDDQPCQQVRSQRPPSRRAEEIQEGGRNFWKQILTDIFILIQNSCERVCFFAKKRRNSVKSNARVRLFSNVR